MISELYAGTTLIPYTNVTSTYYKALSKKDSASKTDINNLSVFSLEDLMLLFLDKYDDFANKNEEFYYTTIKKVLTTINAMSHQLFAADLRAGDFYPELKK